jgi:ABC-type polysaccharide/polyol phosphate export permease
LLCELFDFRSHIKLLFSSEFRMSYEGTALGVIWNFVLPVVPITIYLTLVLLRVLPRLEGISPAVYISFNVTLWHLLIGVLRQPMDVLRSRTAAMTRTAMPLSVAIAASFAHLIFDFLVRAILVIVIVVAMQNWPAPTAWIGALAILSGLVFCLGVGLGLAVLNAIYPDIERVVTIVLQYGIFLSGVVFPISSAPSLAPLEIANPFNVFIHAARELAFSGSLTYPAPVAVWSALGIVLLFANARFFYVMEQRLRGLV